MGLGPFASWAVPGGYGQDNFVMTNLDGLKLGINASEMGGNLGAFCGQVCGNANANPSAPWAKVRMGGED